jgi:P27 family predicted phage terminase small subunit
MDRTALQLLCESFEIYMRAMENIKVNGIVLEEETAQGAIKSSVNPAIKVRESAWVQIHKMCREFGLTPSARCGLSPSSAPNTGDDFLKGVLGISVN